VRQKRNRSGGGQKIGPGRPDKHVLYEASVQNVEFELDFLNRVYKGARGRKPTALREDFCGTAQLAAGWVASAPERTAVGIDLDEATLHWGTVRHVLPLGDAAGRIQLFRGDVLETPVPRADVAVAFNYSYSVFKTRELLRRYFRAVRAGLRRDGLFVVDAFGGTGSTEVGEERRKVGPVKRADGLRVPRFTYVWKQHRYNPVTHELYATMGFELGDGTVIERAFTYDWRFWTLPELRETMQEAGFGRADVYIEGWDEEAEEGDDVFRRRVRFEDQEGWLAYVVAMD
jgi:SAM-dependent methyltransferase